MKNKDIYDYINSIAPFSKAYPWDNVGLLVGDINQDVTGVLVCMDATPQVLEEAVKLGANLILTHHPIIFTGEKSFTTDSLSYQCAKADVSVISAHTNLDVSPVGINFALASALDLVEIEPLLEEKEIYSKDGPVFIGFKGKTKSPTTPEEFAKIVGGVTGLPTRFNNSGRVINTVGLCGGSGYDVLSDALKQGIELDGFVTSEVKHDKFVLCENKGITIFDGGHHGTEMIGMEYLAKNLKEKFTDINITVAKSYTGQLTTV